MYFKNFRKSLNIEPSFNISGIKKLYLINKNYIQRVALTQGIVTDFILDDELYFNLITGEDITFNTNAELSRNGFIYNNEITFSLPKQDFNKLNILNDMMNNELAAIVSDENNKFWLVGNEQGLKATFSGTIDNSNNGYSIKLNNTQLKLAREVAASYVASMVTSVNYDYVPEIPSEPVEIPIEIFIYDDNATVPNEVDIVRIKTGGISILLSESPEVNQKHTFLTEIEKYFKTVTIKGNGKAIEGLEEFNLTEEIPTVELTFTGEGWVITY